MKRIIIDGNEVEISDENFEMLKKQFCKKDLPKSWGELNVVKGYYITPSSRIKEITASTFRICRNTFKYKKEAVSSLAKAQLSQLMYVYNDGWEPDWGSSAEVKYCIIRRGAELKIIDRYVYFSFLAFKTRELAENFSANFEGLIKQYYEMNE